MGEAFGHPQQAFVFSGEFHANVLPEGGADIAKRFAGFDDARVVDRFDGIGHNGKPGTPPAIEGATVFCCSLKQNIMAGSHLIVVGEVQEVREGMTAPLTYLAGAYHRVVPEAEFRAVAGRV